MSDVIRVGNPVGSTSGTVGAYEPKASKPRRQRPWTGPTCPNEDCGSVKTPVRTSGKDDRDRPLRDRVCRDCGTAFVTIEQVVRVERGPRNGGLARFSEVDVEHQRRVTENRRRKFGWQPHPEAMKKPGRVHGTAYIDGRRR
jgi:hypothetical protein